VVCRTEKLSRPEEDHWQLVFGQDGAVVHKEPLSVSRGTGRQHHVSTVELGQTVLKCSLRERVYNWTRYCMCCHMCVCELLIPSVMTMADSGVGIGMVRSIPKVPGRKWMKVSRISALEDMKSATDSILPGTTLRICVYAKQNDMSYLITAIIH